MKLKYYLRGIGIGVIVATLIMTVSSVIHNNNLSKETIIKEAQKLGMVMPESTEDNDSLWGNSTEVESETVSQNTDENDSSETQSIEDTQAPENTQMPEDTQTSEDVGFIIDGDIVILTVGDMDAARQVSEKLQKAGLVEDAEDFRNYLADKGYARDIITGTFEIPKGSSYEEICDIIIKK